MKKSISSFYKERITSLTELKSTQESKLKKILISRIFSFMVLIALVSLSIYLQSSTVLWLLFIPIIVFGFLVTLNRKENAKLLEIDKKLEVNNEETSYLMGDYSSFGNGKEFIRPGHEFSHDFDVFGDFSLFQSLNRTSSAISETRLAELLSDPVSDSHTIFHRQEAIVELGKKKLWREDFRAKGKLFSTSKSNFKLLAEWNSNEIPIFENTTLWKIILWVVPAFMIGVLFSAYFSLIPWIWCFLAAIIPLSIAGKHLKLINFQHGKISKFLPVLEQHSQLTKKIEEESFSSSLLIQIQEKLSKNERRASQEIEELAKLTQQLDNRSNPVFAIFMNALLLWDLRYLFLLKKWLIRNENNLTDWFEATHKMETFLSLATFHFNNPDYCLPQISEETILDSSQLAHPLLDNSSRITNDFGINTMKEFVIITGANMAGKSTFLRAVGVNLILANCGASVCAQSFRFSPTPIFSSMRTSDSLSNNESYFYSELKRLQTIVETLKTGQKLFVILDEILKGTNSKDKAEGSKKFIKQLLKYNVAGIIATHDLSLCSLKEDFPSQIENKYFDVEIENDELVFDYKLKPGICSNMNAEFLMKKMGITD